MSDYIFDKQGNMLLNVTDSAKELWSSGAVNLYAMNKGEAHLIGSSKSFRKAYENDEVYMALPKTPQQEKLEALQARLQEQLSDYTEVLEQMDAADGTNYEETEDYGVFLGKKEMIEHVLEQLA